jgi:cytochrome c biogenesis protein CcmG/thiol:disulfide interchange protein DsbE
MKGNNIVWLVVAIAVAVATFQGVQQARHTQLLPEGSTAPAFSLSRFEGGTVSLEQLKGKVVMVDFWATWCGPCVAEMPMLHKIAQEYQAKGVEFVAADQDEPETAQEAIREFVTHDVPGLGPYVALPNREVSTSYKVRAFPTLYVIDRQGRVVDGIQSAVPEFILRHRLETALAR